MSENKPGYVTALLALPAETAPQRNAARRFRRFLRKRGFVRLDFSVYLRFCDSEERTAAYISLLQQALPPGGLVTTLCFTEKQFADGVYYNKEKT